MLEDAAGGKYILPSLDFICFIWFVFSGLFSLVRLPVSSHGALNGFSLVFTVESSRNIGTLCEFWLGRSLNLNYITPGHNQSQLKKFRNEIQAGPEDE